MTRTVTVYEEGSKDQTGVIPARCGWHVNLADHNFYGESVLIRIELDYTMWRKPGLIKVIFDSPWTEILDTGEWDKATIAYEAVQNLDTGGYIELYPCSYEDPWLTITNWFRVTATEIEVVDILACEIFVWLGDICITIGQIFRDVGDRMGTVWFVGDVIQGWFNAAAGYFEGARDWFYGLGEWCCQMVQGLQLGDAWTWLLGFFSDPGGYIMGFLGTVWTDLQDMYSNFNSWVISALGSTWTDLLDLYNNFNSLVTGALGTAWENLQDLYNNFNSLVTGALGTAWENLQDLYSNFNSLVVGALGGVWEWLTDFVNDPMSKLSRDILELVKSGFEWLTQEWFSFIDSTWDTFKGSFTWLMQKFFLLLDESWDTFEDSMKWLVGKVLDMIGDAAEDFKDKIWDVVEKVVKKL